MSRGTVVAVEGASAAGKTAAVDAAATATGWTSVSEAYRRLRPTPSLDFRTPAELVALEGSLLEEEARRYSEARAGSGSGTTVLADTGFLGPVTYTWALVAAGSVPASTLPPLLSLARSLAARDQWGLADVYVYLDTPASVRSARARADPAGHPTDLAERHARVGAIEREFYRERFAPRLGPRFRWVAGDGPRSLVAERLVAAVRSGTESPAPAASVEAVLALFETSWADPNPSRGNR